MENIFFNYKLFFCLSRRFLYQIFPGNFAQWEALFFKACKIGELDTVEKLVVFFRDLRPGFINAREKKTLNSPVHMAARNGHFVSCTTGHAHTTNRRVVLQGAHH